MCFSEKLDETEMLLRPSRPNSRTFLKEIIPLTVPKVVEFSSQDKMAFNPTIAVPQIGRFFEHTHGLYDHTWSIFKTGRMFCNLKNSVLKPVNQSRFL